MWLNKNGPTIKSIMDSGEKLLRNCVLNRFKRVLNYFITMWLFSEHTLFFTLPSLMLYPALLLLFIVMLLKLVGH